MPQSYISVVIPSALVDETRTLLQQTITNFQPFVRGLSAEERATLVKLGDKSQAFANKVHGYNTTNPGFMPGYVNQSEYSKDFAIPPQLAELHALAQQVFEMIDDTIMAAGSDVMEVSNVYYNSVKQAAANGQPGAQAIYDDLKERYPARQRHAPVPAGS